MGIKNFSFESIETYLQKSKYYIPDYQREYSWTKETEVDDFWKDLQTIILEKDREEHFLGQVVLNENEGKKYIIDGQQRTTTMIILLAVLRDFFYELHEKFNISDAQDIYEDIKIKFIGRYSETKNELKLTLGEVDRDFFRTYIQIFRKKEFEINVEKIPSHIKIKEAYNYFYNEIKKKLDDSKNSNEQYLKLKEIYETFLSKIKVMYVETDNEYEAFIIFETLNARGKDLETADLLKNHLFRISKGNLELVKNTWQKILETLEEIDVTRYIRHYWNSKYSFSREKDLYKRLRDKISTPLDTKEFIEEIEKLSPLYKSLEKPENGFYFDDKDINESLTNLRIMGASTFFPLILSLENKGFSEEIIKKIVHNIETLFLRNCVIGDKVANKYEILFSNLASKITTETLIDFESINKELKDNILSDEEFLVAFEAAEIKQVTTAKYVLREINDFYDNETTVIKDNNKIQLEHIMPKALGDKWNIDNELHTKYLNKIGNLTLLYNKLNNKIKNNTFEVKKQSYSESTIQLNKELINFKEWNIKNIESRQKKLSEIAVKRWNVIE